MTTCPKGVGGRAVGVLYFVGTGEGVAVTVVAQLAYPGVPYTRLPPQSCTKAGLLVLSLYVYQLISVSGVTSCRSMLAWLIVEPAGHGPLLRFAVSTVTFDGLTRNSVSP